MTTVASWRMGNNGRRRGSCGDGRSGSSWCGGGRGLLLWAGVVLVVAAWPAPGARAAEVEYFVTGEVRSSTFSVLPAGTPFTGTYAVDDAVADTNGAADVGQYATGRFQVDFGSAIGRIVFDQSAMTTVVNDSVGLFGIIEDRFVINAGDGFRDTPGFSNEIQGLPSLLFRKSGLPPGTVPTALVDDSLTGVSHVAGDPWDPDDQLISIAVSAVGGGCDPFATSCTSTLAIDGVFQAFTLTVTTSGDGSGHVGSSPAGIDCGATCAADLGGTVVLTAQPEPNSVFVGWTGCDSVDGETCTVFLDAPRTVDAEFQPTPQVPVLSHAGVLALAILLALAGIAVLAVARRGIHA